MARTDRNGQLQPEQELAIARLLLGATDAEAAESAGVARQTVNQWRNHDSVFIATLNDRRQSLWTAHSDRIRALVGQALEVLEEDLLEASEDGRRLRQAAAVHVLRAAGLYGCVSLAPSGPTSAEAVESKQRSDFILQGLL